MIQFNGVKRPTTKLLFLVFVEPTSFLKDEQFLRGSN